MYDGLNGQAIGLIKRFLYFETTTAEQIVHSLGWDIP